VGDITATIRNRVCRGSELLGVKTENEGQNEGQSLTFGKVNRRSRMAKKKTVCHT
jgi:hypothetical protein